MGREKSVEQRVVLERLKKEGSEWKQRTKDAELAIKKYGMCVCVLCNGPALVVSRGQP